MKKKTLLLFTFILLFAAGKAADVTIKVSTQETDLILKTAPNGRLYQSYLGARLLHAADAENLPYYIARPGSDGAVANRGWEVYPGSEAEDFFDPALAVRHVDGNLTTILRYQTHEINKIDDNVTETVIHLKDDVYPVSVRLYYISVHLYNISYAKENVIKTWTEIEHTEKSQSH